MWDDYSFDLIHPEPLTNHPFTLVFQPFCMKNHPFWLVDEPKRVVWLMLVDVFLPLGSGEIKFYSFSGAGLLPFLVNRLLRSS